MAKQPKQPKRVKALSHESVMRPNNPTAELEGLMREEEVNPKPVDCSAVTIAAGHKARAS